MQQRTFTIESLTNPSELSALATEANSDGHGMVTRMIEEWSKGVNRFDKPGERSYLVTIDGSVAGVCGLNIDPFAETYCVGRVRRLYVAVALRRMGIGSAIMRQLLRDAAGHFHELHLRTHDPRAAFYEAIGFTRVFGVEHCTHRRVVAA